ncbi:hypothetical protein DUNSADRAFT_12585, partial [Dunaliella salina]
DEGKPVLRLCIAAAAAAALTAAACSSCSNNVSAAGCADVIATAACASGWRFPVDDDKPSTAHGALQGAINDADMSDADSSAATGGYMGSAQQGSTSALNLPTPLPLGRKGHKGGNYHAPKTPTGKGGGGMPAVQGS